MGFRPIRKGGQHAEEVIPFRRDLRQTAGSGRSDQPGQEGGGCDQDLGRYRRHLLRESGAGARRRKSSVSTSSFKRTGSMTPSFSLIYTPHASYRKRRSPAEGVPPGPPMGLCSKMCSRLCLPFTNRYKKGGTDLPVPPTVSYYLQLLPMISAPFLSDSKSRGRKPVRVRPLLRHQIP